MTRSSTTTRGALAVLLGLAACAPRAARADGEDPPKGNATATPTTGITLAAAPIFGSEATSGNGWSEVVARVENPSGTMQKGVLELSMSTGFGSSEMVSTADAPFAVPAGRTAMVVLPVQGFSAYYSPQIVLSAKGANGAKLESVNVTMVGSTAPVLVEIAQPARLSVALRGWPVPGPWAPAARTAGSSTATLNTGSPSFDRTTGDPILPARPAGYASATVVVVSSERLAALDETHRGALLDWVHDGGSLAVVVSRPEDLRSPLMASLVGGAVKAASAPARLLALRAYKRPTTAGGLGDAAGDDEEEPTTPSPSAAEPRPIRVGPSAATRARLTGYDGGRLAPSDYGASAPCGLGEVHLLAFDPMASPALEDAWAQTRMVDLVEHAIDRRARVAFPLGAGDRGSGRLDDVRRALDPNENYRLGLGISALLLVLYAVVVGPIVFGRATKKGSPLLPLKWVPLTSAAAFFAIVLVGAGVRGFRGRARHLTVLEAASGDGRAAMRAYRGFFAHDTGTLSIAAGAPASVLSAPSLDSHAAGGTLHLERDRMSMTDLRSLPWQTVVVREDGATDLGAGVTLTATPGGNVAVANHTGHVLKDVVVHAPGAADATYFATIDDNEVLDRPRGRPLPGVGATPSGGGVTYTHPLGAGEIAFSLPGREGKRIAEAWSPLEEAVGIGTVDWWPDDAPALVAEVIGLPKAAKDAGLTVESERVLLRVVGEAMK